MEDISILVVDDDKEIAQLVEIHLIAEGYTVFKANNALKGLEILAYHVERRPEFDLPPINPDNVNTRRPLSLKFNYLGNEMIAKCIQDDIGSVAVIFCYAVNGEPPTDVLNTKKLSESLCSCIRHHLNYADDEYLLQIAEDGIIRNYSQAEEVVKQLEDQFNTLHSNKTGKAWNGWKGES
mgnify:CR=1 FL=1